MEWGCISPTGIATVWTSKARGHFGGNHRHHVLVILSSRSQMVGGFSMSPISDDEHCLSLPLIPRPNVLLKELEKAGKEPPGCIQRSIFFFNGKWRVGGINQKRRGKSVSSPSYSLSPSQHLDGCNMCLLVLGLCEVGKYAHKSLSFQRTVTEMKEAEEQLLLVH